MEQMYRVTKIFGNGNERDYGMLSAEEVRQTVKGFRRNSSEEAEHIYAEMFPIARNEITGFYIRKGTENFFFVEILVSR